LRQAKNDGKPFDLALMDMEQAEAASLQGFLNLAAETISKVMVLSDVEPPPGLTNTVKFLPQAFDSVALYRALQQLLSPSADSAQPSDRGRQNNGIRVLVVEDNRANQLVAAGMLERLGYLVEAAWPCKRWGKIHSTSSSWTATCPVPTAMPLPAAYGKWNCRASGYRSWR